VSKAIEQYLARYAEKESQLVIDSQWRRALVIPVYGESLSLLERFEHLPSDVLIILVINAPDHAERDAPAKYEANQDMYDALLQRPHRQLGEGLSWVQGKRDFLVVERFSQLPIPVKQGVGLARKIGADIALRLFQQQALLEPWVHCSDADIHFPESYFDIPAHAEVAAYLYPFRHIASGNARIDQATQRYERWLHHYVDGLRYAGSAYAFHTIGSILAINLYHYAAVRGFPKRSAAEDFYLLNKLAKVGRIVSLDQPCLAIDSRSSDRVPMGTGPAVAAIMRGEKVYANYSTSAFHQLKVLLDYFASLTVEDDISLDALPESVRQWLVEQDFNALMERWRKGCKDNQRLAKAIHDWMDGFRTLKAVRYFEKNPG
tara:strand:+ start:566 stop:1690 length:1125 start_codon:yes stop_codon:yes gene_type:complete